MSRNRRRPDPGLPPAGATLRFMGEHEVTVPLWHEGLMFSRPEQLTQALGVSPRLANEIAEWADAWNRGKCGKEHDAWAGRLIDRLEEELRFRYTIQYHP